jgi:hypothetical protein
VLAACSTQDKKLVLQQVTVENSVASTASTHRFAKYLELAGFRLRESSAGKLEVKFVAVNHSDADLGDITVKVRVRTSQAAPEDPPVTEFEVNIPSFGPQETREITGKAETKLRIYELPDWQFLRTEFDITAPAL